MARVGDETSSYAHTPCCEQGLDPEEVEFLERVAPEFKRLAEGFRKPEVARRFGFAIERDRPNLPPGKVLVRTQTTDIMDREQVKAFSYRCCWFDPYTGACYYCREAAPKSDKGALLLLAGAVALGVFAAGLFARKE